MKIKDWQFFALFICILNTTVNRITKIHLEFSLNFNNSILFHLPKCRNTTFDDFIRFGRIRSPLKRTKSFSRKNCLSTEMSERSHRERTSEPKTKRPKININRTENTQHSLTARIFWMNWRNCCENEVRLFICFRVWNKQSGKRERMKEKLHKKRMKINWSKNDWSQSVCKWRRLSFVVGCSSVVFFVCRRWERFLKQRKLHSHWIHWTFRFASGRRSSAHTHSHTRTTHPYTFNWNSCDLSLNFGFGMKNEQEKEREKMFSIFKLSYLPSTTRVKRRFKATIELKLSAYRLFW